MKKEFTLSKEAIDIPGCIKVSEKPESITISEKENNIIKFYYKRPVYKVTYVVNPDKTYGTPEGSTVPTDPTRYAPNAYVKVADQLTTTKGYAFNEKGEKVLGTWTFTPWDKADFEITEDTTITGGWVFEAEPAKTYKYIVEYRLWDGKNATVQVAPDEKFTIDSLGITVTAKAKAIEDLKRPYCNTDKNGKYLYRIVTPYRTDKIRYDGYTITILYEKIPKGM